MSYVFDPREARDKLTSMQAGELLGVLQEAIEDGVQSEELSAAINCRSREFFELSRYLSHIEAIAADKTEGGNLLSVPGGGGCERVGLLAAAHCRVQLICALLSQVIMKTNDNPNGDYVIIDRSQINYRN